MCGEQDVLSDTRDDGETGPSRPLATPAAPAEADADHEHRDYWEQFYRSEASRKVPTEPSLFARWVSERQQPPGPLDHLEVGNGMAVHKDEDPRVCRIIAFWS